MDGAKLPTIPPHTLQPEVKREEVNAEELVTTWLSKLSQRINEKSFDNLSELFHDECWWRDFTALNWDFSTKHGQGDIGKYLATATNTLTDIQPIKKGGLHSLMVDLAGMIWVQGGFTFKTPHGSGRGLVKLLNVQGTEWKAWNVFTQLEQLDFQKELIEWRKLNPATQARQAAANGNPTNGVNGDKEDLQVLIVGAGTLYASHLKPSTY